MIEEAAFIEATCEFLREYMATREDPNNPSGVFAGPKELYEVFSALKGQNGSSVDGLPLGEVARPHSPDAIFAALRCVVDYSVRTNGHRFLNQLYGRVDPYALAGEWTASMLNTNAHTFEVAPVFTLLEHEIISKVAKTLGGQFKEFDGLTLPGGSSSNLYGMLLARHAKLPDVNQTGMNQHVNPLIAFTSEQAHYSYLKAARVLGVGDRNLISVPCDSSGAMDPTALEHAVRVVLGLDADEHGVKEVRGVPFFLGATAGTTVTGAFDPFEKLAEIAERYDIWMHVDGAWGGSLLFSRNHRHHLNGANRAKSFGWNPHKMLSIPLQCSIFITSVPTALRQCNSAHASYLFQPDKYHADLDVGDKTIQCGRKPDALKLWVYWKIHGDEGIEARIDKALDLANYACRIIASRPDSFQLVLPTQCTNVCFWYIPPSCRPAQPVPESTPEFKATIARAQAMLKGKMQRAGEPLVGYQPLGPLPNFFRLVFPSAHSLEEADVDRVFNSMEELGKDMEI